MLIENDKLAIAPEFTHNAAFAWLEDGISFTWDDDRLAGVKSIRLLPDGIRWSYRLLPRREMASCVHVVPLLVHDGKHAACFGECGPNRLDIGFAGERYALIGEGADGIRVSLDRSLRSTSGVAASAAIEIKPPQAGGYWEWHTELRRL